MCKYFWIRNLISQRQQSVLLSYEVYLWELEEGGVWMNSRTISPEILIIIIYMVFSINYSRKLVWTYSVSGGEGCKIISKPDVSCLDLDMEILKSKWRKCFTSSKILCSVILFISYHFQKKNLRVIYCLYYINKNGKSWRVSVFCL